VSDAGDRREGAGAEGEEAPKAATRAAEPEEQEGAIDDVDMRDLLRSALAPPPGSVAPKLLQGVQRKLRTRSRGKFYGDGWSTADSPRSTYLITAVLMLAILALVYAVLIPWGGGTVP
jgi:hypothetical protein